MVALWGSVFGLDWGQPSLPVVLGLIQQQQRMASYLWLKLQGPARNRWAWSLLGFFSMKPPGEVSTTSSCHSYLPF